MAKLPPKYSFIDVSDYGRKPGRWFAEQLKDTPYTPIDVTTLFIIFGLCSIFFIFMEWYVLAGIGIVLKSIIDAADGELSRLQNRPSYVGRFYDSLSDFFLNFLILFAIYWKAEDSFLLFLSAFFVIELQGTLYNYYYVILRHKAHGDQTSRIFEIETPKALPVDNQKTVNRLFKIYQWTYGNFDKIIYAVDRKAAQCKPFPKWFMTFLSIYGLGFQLLLIALFLIFGGISYLLSFLVAYSIFLFLFIGVRKTFLG